MSEADREEPRAATPESGGGFAMRNAIIVSLALVVTWSVGLTVKLYFPRRLGPDLYGQYRFSEVLALNGLSFVGLGLDTYVQKEIPRRPGHASDFLGGGVLARLLLFLVVLVAMAAMVRGAGHSTEVLETVLIFGVAQFFVLLSTTCATLLYAVRSVGRLSAVDITSKLLWAAGIAIALSLRAPLYAYALPSLLAEGLRLVALYRLSRRTLGFALRVDVQRTWEVLRRSAPFYLAQLAQILYTTIDVAIMGMLLPDREVGLYGAATNISNVAMLMAPLFGWVLTPELSRLAGQREALVSMLRRSFEWLLALALPVSLVLGLGADVIVHAVFGGRYDPAVGAMRAIAPMFVVVYVAMLGATGLILLERAWTVTLVTVISVAVNAGLNLLVLRPAFRALGDGGAGIAASFVSVFTETAVAVTYVALLGHDILDRRNAISLAKSLAATGAVVAFHARCPIDGVPRLALDVIVYVALVVGSRAVRLSEVVGMFQAALRHRRARRGGA